MQREITSKQPLLDEKGALIQPGYARKMMFEYDRNKVGAGPFSL
jgi:hypothetical protein